MLSNQHCASKFQMRVTVYIPSCEECHNIFSVAFTPSTPLINCRQPLLLVAYRFQSTFPWALFRQLQTMHCSALKAGASRSGVTPGSRGFLRPVRPDVHRPQACGPRRSRVRMQPTPFDAFFEMGLGVSPFVEGQLLNSLKEFEKTRARIIPVDVVEVSSGHVGTCVCCAWQLLRRTARDCSARFALYADDRL